MSSRLKFFDANCMIGRLEYIRPRSFYTVQRLVKEMKYYSIDRAVVFHTLSWKYDSKVGNYKLLEEINNYDQLYPCWTLLPPATMETGSVKEVISEIIRNNVRAVRLFPGDHAYELKEWIIGELFSALEEYRIPVWINVCNPATYQEQIDWDDIFNICSIHPNLPIVLAKTGFRLQRKLYPLMDRHSNILLELSDFIMYRGLESIVSRYGAERLLFGTWMPINDPGATLAIITYADIKREEKELIAYKNLENLLMKVTI